MSGKEVVFRIITKAGRLRLVCDPQRTSLAEFRAQVAEKLRVEPAQVVLTLDANGNKIMLDDTRKLASWDLRIDGTEIYAFADAKHEFKPVSTQPPPLPAAPRTPRTPRTPKKSGGGGSEGQKYKTFEEFLQDSDFNVSQLPLNQSFLSVKRNLVGPTKLPPSISLKHQPYRHVDHVEVMNVGAITGFVQRWKALDMLCQRAAFLIGYYTADPHFGPTGMRAVVEALYEPALRPESEHFHPEAFFEAKPLDELAFKVAEGLGLEVVGWAFTHLGRKTLITGPELIRMARLQLAHIHTGKHYTGYPISTFVTLTISPKESLGGEPGSDAFAVSDLGLAMVRDRVLGDADALAVRDPNVESESDNFVHVRQPTDRNELMAGVLESTKEVQKLDTDWLLVRLAESAPKEVRLLIKRNAFPPANVSQATFEDVGAFLEAGSGPPHEKLADFHFILFIANTLGYESAEQIIRAVRTGSDIAPEFYTLLKSLA